MGVPKLWGYHTSIQVIRPLKCVESYGETYGFDVTGAMAAMAAKGS